MTYVQNTSEDRERMLSALGLHTTDQLFDSVPAPVRFPDLALPDPLSELEAMQKFSSLAGENRTVPAELSFVGGGAYNHFIPAVVPALSSRGEFVTSYTPYQPEVSQGTLQSIFEYQSMVSDLLGMEVVNASHYDGATALAEAVLMSIRASRDKRRRVVCSPGIHPQYQDVIQTYLQGSSGIRFEFPGEEGDLLGTGPSVQEMAEQIDDETACMVVPYPDALGRVPDLRGIAEKVHERGALLVVHTNPAMLGIFRSPGELGADIVTAEGQPLGIPLSFGGPYLGLFACTQGLVRRMPGRLVGETVDRDGRRSYVLTLSTREQHIRREKATSNICTNQGLMALRAAIYLAAMGKQGMRRVSELCYHRAHYAADRIAGLSGYRVESQDRFFHEFVVRTPRPASEIIDSLAADGIVPGIALQSLYPGRSEEALSHAMLVCVTEMQNRAAIDRLVAALASGGAE